MSATPRDLGLVDFDGTSRCPRSHFAEARGHRVEPSVNRATPRRLFTREIVVRSALSSFNAATMRYKQKVAWKSTVRISSEFIPSSVWKTAPQRSVSIWKIDKVDPPEAGNIDEMRRCRKIANCCGRGAVTWLQYSEVAR